MKKKECMICSERTKKDCLRAGRVFASLGMPLDADGRTPVVTVTGGRYVKVAHHTGILKFTGECVRLFTRAGAVRIEGKDLVSSSMDSDTLLLEGRIKAVFFE